jgi:hypothetical protein
MPYAIVAYFDKDSDQTIKNIWKLLAEADVCDYLHKSENNPHIKLGMYDELMVAEAQAILEDLSKTTNRLKVHFKNIGIYPNEKPIVFLDISVTSAILDLQKQVQALFTHYSHEIGSNYFDEGIWKPDCFLTMSIEQARLQKAIDVIMHMNLPFEGFIERVGLIEFHPARQIFSYPFME